MHSFCHKCHYPLTHPLGLLINEYGCSGCLTHEEKYTIDWMSKKSELDEIIRNIKKKKKKGYDCVVPVVGDAEDFYTVSKVLELGLSPLIVCVNDFFKNDIGWHNIHQLITYFDVDSFTFNPDMRVYKDLVRTSLRKYNHILLPFLQLHTSFPVHIANERRIPLVVWGQNQAVEQVGKFSHHDKVEMSRWGRREHDLFNVEVDSLVGNGAQVDLRSLNYYKYPRISSLSRSGIKGIYLSNYMPWDPIAQNRSTIEFGFQPEKNNSTFDIYERAGNSVYYHLHDLLKYKRTGYRKVSDHVAREIRHGRLASSKGKFLIDFYTNSKVYIKPFFDWLDVTSSGYEWFKMHRLNDFTDYISEKPVEPQIYMDLPNSIESLLCNSNVSKKDYIFFAKGIYI